MSNRRHRRRAEVFCGYCDRPIPNGAPLVVALVGCDEGCVHELVLHEACRDLLGAALGLTADEGENVDGAVLQRWA